MTRPKRIRWLPVISFGCVLLLFFSAGSLVNAKIGIALVGFVVSSATILSLFFPDHLKHLMDLWSEKILDESHRVIIFISILFASALIFIIGREYRIKIVKVNQNE